MDDDSLGARGEAQVVGTHPPSLSERTVDQVGPPSADRYKELASEAAETTSVPALAVLGHDQGLGRAARRTGLAS